MITEKDLREAIAECEGQKNPNSNTCIKLAAFYTIMNNLYPKQDKADVSVPQTLYRGYSYSPSQDVIEYGGESEFAQAIEGMNVYDLLDIIDELMDTLKVLNPKLYDAVMRRLSE